MKKFVLSLALLLSITPSYMVFADCSHDLAAQIVDVNFAATMKNLDRMYGNMFEQIAANLVPSSGAADRTTIMESIKPEVAEFSDLCAKAVKELLENKKAALISFIQTTIANDTEAQELLGMLKSPVMQRFQDRLPEMAAAFMPSADELAAMQTKLSDVTNRLRAKVDAFMVTRTLTDAAEASSCCATTDCTKNCSDADANCCSACTADEAERGKITCSCNKPKPAKKDENESAEVK